jgi:hypothetical protein
MLGLKLGTDIFKSFISKDLSLNPTKDAFINIWVPDTVYNSTNLQVYNGGELDSLYTLLYFDLSSIIGKKIKTANLKLYADDLQDTTIIGMQRITSNWSESTVTWNTKPDINETVYYEESVLIGSNEWKTFDIKTLIQAIADGATYQGIWLFVGNEIIDYRWCQFSSKEGYNKPILEIVYYL